MVRLTTDPGSSGRLDIFTEHSKNKLSIRGRLKKLALMLASVAVLGLVLFALIYFSNILPTKTRSELQKRQEQEEALFKTLSVSVLKAGYIKRSAGFEELYIPLIALEVTNVSEKSKEKLILYAYFFRKDENLCGASVPIFNLNPKIPVDVELKCLESMGFGTVAHGLSLMQTTKPVSYSISAVARGVFVVLLQGEMEFNLIRSSPH